MIAINSALGALVVVIGLALVFTIVVSLQAYKVLNKSLDILLAVYDWLEEARREQIIYRHEGTE